MKLTVLGCAGSFPSTDSACSSYHLEADGFRLLIDFGTGSLSALQRYKDIRAVDAIVLSHLHSDHVLDACSYVVVRRYAPDGPYPRIPVYGPSGARERMIGAYGSPDEGPLDDVYMFHTLRPDTFSIGPFTVTAERVEHPVETFGVRIEHDGKVLAYSADTAPCDAIVRLAAGADAFLCEASYLTTGDNPPGLHMTGRDAGESATKAGAARLLLTHLVPAWGDEASTVEEARSTFDGPIDVVRPGAVYEI